MQFYLLLGCTALYFNLVTSRVLLPDNDLITAASNGKSNTKYFSRGDGNEYENGYAKSGEDKGTGGYDKYETFETKDGDAFDYEKHEGHGNVKKGKKKQ